MSVLLMLNFSLEMFHTIKFFSFYFVRLFQSLLFFLLDRWKYTTVTIGTFIMH